MTRRALIALLALISLAGTGGSAKEGEIRPFKRGSWQAIQRAHAGRSTVVHFWGLTCGPCRVEMPLWGKLLQERSDLNLVVIEAERYADLREALRHDPGWVTVLDEMGEASRPDPRGRLFVALRKLPLP